MRKVQKKQIEELLDLLEQAHQEIKGFVERKEFIKAQELLGQCQESAVQVGELIEMEEGELAPTIAKLENYCEVLYEIYEELSSDTMIMAAKIYKRLQKVLIQVENSVKNEIKPRLEVVFLPYKASMWDSLESVWRAADADKNTDAYVIPIPYFDRNPDGSFKEEHYEGGQYPEYVPVIRYDEYDFEQRRPDVIYIHNAYDNWNMVTSVHPDFFSHNLMNYTERLVYIPYFVLGEIEPDNEKAIESVKHFCFMPGIIYADKVIVQSENMKKIYMNEYLKAAKEHGLQGSHVDKAYLEQKFLGLGSPKYDKVLNTRKEDLDVPKKWLKVIEKPDGSLKKIILYNTGITALLAHNEEWVDKIEDVFKIFKENCENIALLWRPHPLIENTMRTMRPQVLKRYLEIKMQYLEEGWGIYDDTADLNRAMALSDAYYGDRSSMVHLYRKVGKRVLIQKCTVRSHGINSIALTEAVAEVDGYYWYVPLWKNALFRMNRETLETEWMCSFQEEKMDLELYANICVHEEELILIPCKAKKIAVYNRSNKSITTIDFLEKSYQLKDAYLYDWFMQYVVIGEKMYFIPCMYHSLICMDLDTKEISKIRITEDSFNEEIIQISSTAAAVRDHRFYFVSEDEKKVYVFDTQKQCLQRLNLNGKKYSGLFYIEKQLWLIPFNGFETLDIYDLENEKIVDRLQFPKKVVQYASERKGRSFAKGIVKNKKIYLLANLQVASVVIDIRTREITEWCLPEVKIQDESCLNWIGLLESKDQLYVINGLTGEWAVEDRFQDRWIYWNKKPACANISDFQDDYMVENYGNIFGSRIEDLLKPENNLQIDQNINMGMKIYLATK